MSIEAIKDTQMQLYILTRCKYCYKVAVMLPAISEKVELCEAESLDDNFFKSIGLKRMFPLLLRKDGLYMQESQLIIDYLEEISDKPLKYGKDLYKQKQIFDMQNILFPYMRDAICYYQKIHSPYSFTHVYGKDNISLGPGVDLGDAQNYANQLEILLVGEQYVPRTIIRKEDIYIYPDIRAIYASQSISPFKLGPRTIQYYNEINSLCGFTPYMVTLKE